MCFSAHSINGGRGASMLQQNIQRIFIYDNHVTMDIFIYLFVYDNHITLEIFVKFELKSALMNIAVLCLVAHHFQLFYKVLSK